jgi:hypothetical protein
MMSPFFSTGPSPLRGRRATNCTPTAVQAVSYALAANMIESASTSVNERIMCRVPVLYFRK